MTVKVLIVDNAREEFEKLNEVVGRQRAKGVKNSEEIQLLKSIKKKSELLKSNPAYGNKIPRKLWPKELVEKYDLTNLWRVELTNYWRILYTLKGDRIEVLCFIIKLFDHETYDKLFKYNKT
ncbi:hypothetical protein COX85_01130 [Candidatus Micrarchaeota archaeon CG_4_10_14_0_2_um_filter_55_9]|nr:MAG: hypothetical protein COT57_01755 [Candidatus Micrarchaeota archaeon CG09_land_8_20_14_0_10_55_25]PIZ91954.1 MAG: hypothetical protein COX85_01130 [Candidatus Micrarchaeota archaeon CG_4_10_14_0_2_um_filter_55_9]PJD00819.1 MAG: hypothetical protein COU38_04315 [Candidatus Micrarchaeota archaeon CG10_big_fil_rev_8_21_14_0_10_54_18]